MAGRHPFSRLRKGIRPDALAREAGITDATETELTAEAETTGIAPSGNGPSGDREASHPPSA